MLVTVDLSDKSRIEPCKHALCHCHLSPHAVVRHTIGESQRDDLSPRGPNFWSNTRVRDVLSAHRRITQQIAELLLVNGAFLFVKAALCVTGDCN